MQQNILRVFAMFNAQVELLRQIATQEGLNARLEARVEMSIHCRDEHRGHFDGESSLRQKQAREDKLRALHDKVKLNADEINKMMKEAIRTPETQ